MESLDNINLGRVSNNDFKESSSTEIIKRYMEKNKRIKVRTNEADKIPNLDGKVMILDDKMFERITVEVQIKTLPSNYIEKKPYKYSCDTKVFNVVTNYITFNPVVLLLVDTINEKLYWKNISFDYAKNLNIGKQDNKTITFDDNDLFDESTFIKTIENEHKKKTNQIISKNENPFLIANDNYNTIELQNEVDRLNTILDNDLSFVKRYLFPNVWKFGLAYSEDNEGRMIIGIYKIIKGKNDILIRNFEMKKEYMQVSLSLLSSKSIRDSINDWIENIVNTYFNIVDLDLKYLPSEVLFEIVYNFLDRLSMDIKELQKEKNDCYKSDTEKLTIVKQYYNGLKCFYDLLIKKYPNSNLTTALKRIYPNYGNRFLIFNPLLQPSEEEYLDLVRCIKTPSNVQNNVRFVGSDLNIDLLEQAINELEKRRIKEIHRIWIPKNWELSKLERQDHKDLRTTAHGYLIHDLYQNLDILYKNLDKFYSETYECMFSNKNNFRLNGKFLITYSESEPYQYTMFYKDNEVFNVEYLHMKKNEAIMKYGDLKIYNVQCNGNIDSAFSIDLPLYNHIRYLINLGVSLSLGIKFKYDGYNRRPYLMNTDIPIICNYINLCEEKSRN